MFLFKKGYPGPSALLPGVFEYLDGGGSGGDPKAGGKAGGDPNQDPGDPGKGKVTFTPEQQKILDDAIAGHKKEARELRAKLEEISNELLSKKDLSPEKQAALERQVAELERAREQEKRELEDSYKTTVSGLTKKVETLEATLSAERKTYKQEKIERTIANLASQEGSRTHNPAEFAGLMAKHAAFEPEIDEKTGEKTGKEVMVFYYDVVGEDGNKTRTRFKDKDLWWKAVNEDKSLNHHFVSDLAAGSAARNDGSFKRSGPVSKAKLDDMLAHPDKYTQKELDAALESTFDSGITE